MDVIKGFVPGNGRVIINRNICDNAQECSGISICPTGALHWDKASECIAYNRESCIDCGACANEETGGCPIGAILWGVDDIDYEKKWKAVSEETRKLEDLEIERYGASPIAATIEVESIMDKIETTEADYVLIEFFCEDSINCLLHSIPIDDIMSLFDGSVCHFKVEVESVKDAPIKIESLPALAVYRNGKLIGQVSGYYDDSDETKTEFFNIIRNIIG